MKHPPPEQYDTERHLSDSLSHGDVEHLAALLKCSPSLICQMCNPNDPKKSWFYQNARFLWAAYRIREDLGEVLFGRLQALRHLWLSKDKPCRPDVSKLASRVTSEIADVVIAELERKPMQDRFREAQEARMALDEYILGLMQQSDEDGQAEDSALFGGPRKVAS